jgi:hypothetical protein
MQKQGLVSYSLVLKGTTSILAISSLYVLVASTSAFPQAVLPHPGLMTGEMQMMHEGCLSSLL